MKNKLFEIGDYIDEKRKSEQVTPTITTKKITKQQIDNFQQLIQQVKQLMNADYEKLSDKEQNLEIEQQRQAIIGNQESKQTYLHKIKSILEHLDTSNVSYYDFYGTLENAILQNIFGFSHFYKWEKYPESTDGIIQGKRLWFYIGNDPIEQESLENDEVVEEIVRGILLRMKNVKLNENNPETEIDTENNWRIKIMIPPLVPETTIIFRKFIVGKYSFDEQARRKTIGEDAVNLFKIKARLMLNELLAGAVESGKSTLLTTNYAERDPSKVGILFEDTKESRLKDKFPNRLVYEIFTKNYPIHQAIKDAMRIRHDFMMFQEVRGYEADAAINGAERGARGLILNYHISNPANAPRQLANHITDVYPSRSEASQIRRIAEALDLGITMKTVENNRKIMTSLYEFYIGEDDQPYINYLMKYNFETKQWHYNANITDQLRYRMQEEDPFLANQFEKELQMLAARYPGIENPIEKCR